MDEILKRSDWELIITVAGLLGGMEERKEVEIDSWGEFQEAVEYALKKYLDDETATDFFTSVETGLKEFFSNK